MLETRSISSRDTICSVCSHLNTHTGAPLSSLQSGARYPSSQLMRLHLPGLFFYKRRSSRGLQLNVLLLPYLSLLSLSQDWCLLTCTRGWGVGEVEVVNSVERIVSSKGSTGMALDSGTRTSKIPSTSSLILATTAWRVIKLIVGNGQVRTLN